MRGPSPKAPQVLLGLGVLLFLAGRTLGEPGQTSHPTPDAGPVPAGTEAELIENLDLLQHLSEAADLELLLELSTDD